MSEKIKEIKLKIDNINNVVYEEPDEFQSSVLYDAYLKAFEITKEIVKNNKLLVEARDEKAHGSHLRNTEQIYNIISFTGSRGAGKTSAMLSFMEFLKDYYRIYSSSSTLQEMKFDNGAEKFMFTGLEHIDASLLESKEDILGTVLAKMIKKWKYEESGESGRGGIEKGHNYDYKRRKIQQQFDIVFRCLKDLKSQGNIMESDDDMFMVTLEKLAFTGNLIEAFQELVEQFLDIMKYYETNVSLENHFLVISIDDLDMDIKHSFRLLEQIRKYLMVPKVIVLLSANYEQLENICKNHYSEQYKNIIDKDNIGSYIEKLSREYLEKMIPVQRQVILTSGIKWKFFDKEKLNIVYKDVDDKEEKKVIHSAAHLKEVVKIKYNEIFKANFDVRGKNLNYLMPETLRQIVSWTKQTILLDEITNNNVIKASNKNYEWFWNEEFPLLCKRKLTLKEYDIFQAMERLNPREQKKLIMKYCIEINPAMKSKRSMLEIFAEFQQGQVQEQEISSMAIIYFTMKISQIVICIENVTDLEANRAILLEYFSDGVWGDWERHFIAEMVKSEKPESDNVTSSFPVRFARTEFKASNKCFSLDLAGKLYEKIEDRIVDQVIRFIVKNKKKIENYQYVLLFYRLNTRMEQDQNNMWYMNSKMNRIELIKDQNGTFALSNFVINILDDLKLVKKFLEELPYILFDGNMTDMEKVKRAIEKCSIIESMEKVVNESTLLLPLNDIEYLIKTGIKIEEKMGYTTIVDMNISNISYNIKNYFDILEESLEEYDTLYSEPEWKNNFSNNPLIKRGKEDEEFMTLLAHSIMSHVVEEMPGAVMGRNNYNG